MNKRAAGRPFSPVVSFEEARALAKEHGTPLLVCDLDRVKQNYRRLKAVAPGLDLYYAVKANPHPFILRTLVGLGSKFDVASKNEILMCMEAGAKPSDLLYANPIKPPEYLEFAHAQGVRGYTFDAESELVKMAKYAPGARVILRLAVKDVGSVCKFSTKFGAKEKNAVDLLVKAKQLGLKPEGLSFHVGSQCTNLENYSTALDMCARVMTRASKRGIDLSVLDMGGGIPIRYVEDVYSFEELSELIRDEVEGLFPRDLELMMEPGRPMVGDAMTLLTKVIGVSKRNGDECVYLDDGCYNSLSEKVFGHCEYSLLSDKKGPVKEYTVFGPTCDSMDMIKKDVRLPEVTEGDLIVIPNAGAYTNAAATHFNGFDPARILFL